MRKNRTPIIVIVLILAGVSVGLTLLGRPRVLPAGGPVADFSAERAMEHVSAISQASHPPGSEEIERVRTYILAQLGALGLSPEIQETTVAVSQGSTVVASTIENIVVKTWDLVPEVLDHLGTIFQPRSSDMMPMPNFDYGTVVVKTLRIS